MLQFKSDKSAIDVQYGNPQININEVLMVSDLFSFHDIENMKTDLVQDYGTDKFTVKQREFVIIEELTEEPNCFI
ncbi:MULTISPECIES: hypothetical protein [Chryseobacterium]|uniref:Uncharacterized protein n=1 Tax=Chryseobacterium muglaense TaxID=2893752 RepID=A0ABR8ME41_9FLAO|nr:MULTISPECIES: hypothetical protein [Chryseobacterium]MBD3906755.1 hypothetical protein [Chryseobacterium muglaense]